MNKKLRNLKIITVVTLIIMFICTIILVCQLIKIGNLKNTTSKLETQKDQLLEDIKNYNTANNYYSNNRTEFLEDYARDELGWSKKDEVWYVKK
jgi:cell division protein FtsB